MRARPCRRSQPPANLLVATVPELLACICNDPGMPLMDYFSATDDTDAARVVPGSGGPAALGVAAFQTKGIDPAVALGTLESILTARPYDEVATASRQCQLVTGGEADALVVTVTDALRDALAAVGEQGPRRVAEKWAATDELAGTTPEILAEALDQFALLARNAVERGHHLYCWWAL